MKRVLTSSNKFLMSGGRWLTREYVPPEPPTPVLPPFTIRLRFMDGEIPYFRKGTAVQVSYSPNIWDLTYADAPHDWDGLVSNLPLLIEVVDANTTGVTRMGSTFMGCYLLTSVPLFDTSSVLTMSNMFYGCSSLTTVPLFNTSSATSMNNMFGRCSSLVSVPLFNTSSVTTMSEMFDRCSSLTSVPLFDTSSVDSMDYMFSNCTNVQSGALALYQQASSQSVPPTHHDHTFSNCGRDTVTGAAELAQIPADWK